MTCAIQYLHKQDFFHHDIKLDNILLDDDKLVLCDFGSCSEFRIELKNLTKAELSKWEERFERNSTLTYRPPEMMDVLQRYTVDHRADLWMLGCVVYCLCFLRHPFESGSKMAITNALYDVPKDHPYSERTIRIITGLLQQNPRDRMTLTEVMETLNLEDDDFDDFQ